MKSTIQTLAVIALIGTLGFAGSVYAEIPTDLTEKEMKMVEKKRETEERFKTDIKEKLGLSDEQQQKLKEVRRSHRGEVKESFQSMEDLRAQLQAELGQETFDAAKVRSIHERLKSLKAKTADQRLEGILAVREILTAEQFKKFQELEGHGKKGQWGGKHKGDSRGFMTEEQR